MPEWDRARRGHQFGVGRSIRPITKISAIPFHARRGAKGRIYALDALCQPWLIETTGTDRALRMKASSLQGTMATGTWQKAALRRIHVKIASASGEITQVKVGGISVVVGEGTASV